MNHEVNLRMLQQSNIDPESTTIISLESHYDKSWVSFGPMNEG